MLLPFALLHVASWFAMLAHGRDWVGAWMNAVDQVAGSVVIVGPLVAGLTAHIYARQAETALPSLAVASVHPFRGWYDAAARYWLLAVVNLVTVLGEVAVLVAVAGPRMFLRPLLVLPICFLVLAAHVLLGMALGLRLGPRLAGAVAGTASFGLFLLAVAHLAPASFEPGGVAGVLVGLQVRAVVLLTLAAAAFLSVIAVGVVTGWGSSLLRLRTGAAVVAVALALVLSNGGADLDNRYEPTSLRLACRGSAPEVCVPVDAPRSLPAAASSMHRLARPLVAAGIALPRRWVYHWGQRPDPRVGALVLLSSGVLTSHAREQDIVTSLTMPATCPDYYEARETPRSLQIRQLLATWLAFRNGLGLDYTTVGRAWFASPESEQWVRATYVKLRRCDLGGLTFPKDAR